MVSYDFVLLDLIEYTTRAGGSTSAMEPLVTTKVANKEPGKAPHTSKVSLRPFWLKLNLVLVALVR